MMETEVLVSKEIIDIDIEESKKNLKKNKHKHKKFYKKVVIPKTIEERRASFIELKKDLSQAREHSYILRLFYWIKNAFNI